MVYHCVIQLFFQDWSLFFSHLQNIAHLDPFFGSLETSEVPFEATNMAMKTIKWDMIYKNIH